MFCCHVRTPMCLVAAGLIVLAGAAAARPAKDSKPASTPTRETKPATTPKDKTPPAPSEMHLPPGWTEADMQACIDAGTPGPMHQWLAEGVGTWHGKVKQWMSPDSEPVASECVSKVTTFLDGRFTRCEISGDMPGMGPFQGFGIYGYDNVSQKFQSSWVSNCGTGIMFGTGTLSSDGTTLTWEYTYHCPIAKKPTTMREIERRTSKDTFTLESHGADPKTGRVFKMMEIQFTRQRASATAPSGH